MEELYQPLIDKNIPIVITNLETAETIKYASNNFLALKLSFINEMANLCESTGANIDTVSYAIGLDQRIGPHFLKPGPGYGGSCLPKDTKVLLTTAKKLGLQLKTVAAAIKANKYQKTITFKKLKTSFNGDLTGKTIAILGLAFKADTDDIRYSPAIPLIKKLLTQGVHIKVYDPAAMDNMKRKFPSIAYCESTREAMQDSDAIVLLTDWDEFKKLELPNKNFSKKVIIDPRNILNKEYL
jgi:UDPglucose 6-dehydrogenase